MRDGGLPFLSGYLPLYHNPVVQSFTISLRTSARFDYFIYMWWKWNPGPCACQVNVLLHSQSQADIKKKYYFFLNQAETGELTQRLRAFVLADDLGSIISTHVVAHDPL